jgi:mRNA-degrading endonuclease RelE of RelBE toxin-antitoxin system
MGIPVRIDETVYNQAKMAANAEFRSVPRQIEYWAQIGRCALDNPDLPIEFIRDILILNKKTHTITIKQMPAFRKTYKKLYPFEKAKINDAIRAIIKNPKIGQQKKGDLAGVFVHKFKIRNKQMLLAYEWETRQRLLLALGVHENFYRDLKKQR